jgi:hypothetical protein
VGTLSRGVDVVFPALVEGITLETLRNSYCDNPISVFDLVSLFDLNEEDTFSF